MTPVRTKSFAITVLPAFAAFMIPQARGGGGSNGAQVLHRGGTTSDTNASPTATRSPGFGTWVKSGATYRVRFRFYTDGPTRTVSVVNRVKRTVTLAAAGGTATLVNATRSFDLTAAPTDSTCATDVSTRVL